MSTASRHRVSRRILAGVLALSLVAPSAAIAAPSASPTGTVDQKRAEQSSVLSQVDRVRADLAVADAEYTALCRDLEQTAVEVSEATTQLAAVDAELAAQEKALADRAVQLYRGEQLNIIEVLLGSQSIQDLMDRANYLYTVTSRDARLITEVRKTRAENLWLAETLENRLDRLTGLQRQADDKREQIETQLLTLQSRAKALDSDIAALLTAPKEFTGGDPTNTFQPENVITDANFRNASSMTQADIQAFLAKQPGVLDTYKTKDHTGVVKPASQIIYEAAVAWNISPKVILATLQKEQSLLSTPNPKASQFNGAMGAGMPDSGRDVSSMQGFGNQVWWGAQKLSSYGERFNWVPGKTKRVDGSTITPVNVATFSLYTYTPHFAGVKSFWMLYWRYFGDPLAATVPVVTPQP